MKTRLLPFLTVLPALLTLLALSSCSDAPKQAKTPPAVDDSVPEAKGPEIVADRYWNDLARYFGGLPALEGSLTDTIDSRPEAQAHRQYFDRAWALRFEKTISKLGPWAEQEFPNYHSRTGTVFYPFGAVDFHTVHALFPKAERYVLFGLEEEGLLPDRAWLASLDHRMLKQNLERLDKSVDDILFLTFFKTKDMSGDFKFTQFTGSLPILLALMARSGQEVLKVEPMIINRQGKAVVNPNPPQNFKEIRARDSVVTGMRVWFRAGANAPLQSVEYYGTDVEDPHIVRTPQFIAFLKSLKPCIGYVKSASYLMHWDNFTTVRNTLMEVADMWLQDDTGVAMKYVDTTQWSIRYYGAYDRPIDLFANRYQKELAKAYNIDKKAKEIPFGMGYTSRAYNSNLQLMERRNAAR